MKLTKLINLVLLLTYFGTGQCRSRRDLVADLDRFPNPTTEFEKCGRKQESYICDPELYIRPKS